MTKLLEQLKVHEGFREHVYKCTAGHDTVGYGYNIEANPLHLSNYEIVEIRKNGIKQANAETILKICVAQTETELEGRLPWFGGLDDVRRDTLVNMAFNLGVKGLLKFKNTLAHIEKGEFEKAALEMLESAWAKQVHGRAMELANQMRTGRYA